MTPLIKKDIISTKVAAQLSGYTPDYLARLCRSGKINGEQVGRAWLIERASLEKFLETQINRNTDRARELSRSREKEYSAASSAFSKSAARARVAHKVTRILRAQLPAVPRAWRNQGYAIAAAVLVVLVGAGAAQADFVDTLETRALATLNSRVQDAREFAQSIEDAANARMMLAAQKTSDTRIAVGQNSMRATDAASSAAIGFGGAANLHFILAAGSAPNIEEATRTKQQEPNKHQTEDVAEVQMPNSADVAAVANAITHPQETARAVAAGIARSYFSLGTASYHLIGTALDAYTSGIERAGAAALALATGVRDAETAAPAAVLRAQIALGTAVVAVTHGSISHYADGVRLWSAVTPEMPVRTAQGVLALGDALGNASARITPALATAYLGGIYAIGQVGGSFVGGALALSAPLTKDLATLSGRGFEAVASASGSAFDLAREGTSHALVALGLSSNFVSNAPATVQDFALGTAGKTAVALDNIQTQTASAGQQLLGAVQENQDHLLAGAYDSLTTGERAAYFTYSSIRNFFTDARFALENIFTPPTLVYPSPTRVAVYYPSTTPTTIQNIQNIQNVTNVTNQTKSYVQGVIGQVLDNLDFNKLVDPIFIGLHFDDTSVTAPGNVAVEGTLDVTGTTTLATTTVSNFTVSGDTTLDGNLTLSGFTAGSVPYIGASGALSQDNGNFFWDVSNHRLGLGTTTPSAALSLVQGTNGETMISAYRATDVAPSGDFIDYKTAAGTTLFRVDNSGNLLAGGIINSGSQTITSVSSPQLRIQYDASNETTLSVTSTGNTSFAVNGSAPALTFVPQSNSVNTFNFIDAASASVLSIDTLNRRVGVGTTSPAVLLDLYGTDALRLPVGTSGERPSGDVGFVRFNTDTHQFEGYGDNGVWQGLGGVIDADQDSYITADTGNTDEDTLRFFTVGSERLTILPSGNIGVGLTTPSYLFEVAGIGRFSGLVDAANFVATSTTATSTLAGGLNVGNGALNYDFSSGVTSIQDLAIGAMSFDTDAGIISWIDLPLSSTPTAGTVESYSAQIGGTSVFTVYGEADGAGNAQNLRFGIASGTPTYALSVEGTSSLGNTALSGYFTATSTAASTFPYASTTALSAGAAAYTTLLGDYATSSIRGGLAVYGNTTSGSASALTLQRGSTNGNNTLAFNDQSGAPLLELYTSANSGHAYLTGYQSYLDLGTNTGGTALSIDTSHNVNTTANLVPTANQTYNLGSAADYWNNAYVNTIFTNNLTSASTSISGTNVSSFTIDSQNPTTDAEDISLIFYRGAGATANAVLSWDATNKRFAFNQNARFTNQTGSTASTTLQVAAITSQTAPLTSWLDSSGNVLDTILPNGNVGIGTTSPYASLSVMVGGNYASQAASTAFAIGSSTAGTATSTLFTVLSSGNVGIGTTGPTQLLTLGDTDSRIGTDSVDGTDNKRLQISGAAASASRGSYINLFGNEYASSGGSLGLVVGAAAGSTFTLTQNSVNVITSESDSATANTLYLKQGNVGINTAVPQTKLQIATSYAKTDTTFRSAFYLTSNEAAASNPLVMYMGLIGASTASTRSAVIGVGDLNSSNTGNLLLNPYGGNVGIGVTTPVQRLEVYGASGVPATSGTTQNGIVRIGNTSVGGSPTSVLDIGRYTAAPYGMWLQTSDASNLAAHTQVPMVLQPNGGFVGIGTTDPASYDLGVTKLVVANTAGHSGLSIISGTASVGSVYFGDGTDGNSAAYRGGIEYNHSDDSMKIWAGANTTPPNLFLTSTGNVGIGTTTPGGYKLAIAGGTYGSLVWGTSTHADQGTLTYDTGKAIVAALSGNDLSFGANGVPDQLYIKSGGNVGIGTTGPGAKLEVSGPSTAEPIIKINGDNTGSTGISGLNLASGGTVTSVFTYDSATGENKIGGVQSYSFPTFYSGNAEAMRITTAGKVGIGTTTPASHLDIYTTPAVNGNVGVSMIVDGAAQSARVAGSGNVIAFRGGNDLDYYGSIGGYSNAANSSGPGMGIWGNAISGAPSLYVNSGGYVGIGVTNPTVLLHVEESKTLTTTTGGGSFLISNTNASVGNVAAMYFLTYEGASNRRAQISAGMDTNNGSSAAGFLAFTTRTSVGTFGERMRIDAIGNVGIGTTDPSSYSSATRSLTVVGTGSNTSGLVNAFASGSGIDSGGVFVLGGDDGSTAQRSYAFIAGRKENSTVGNYDSYLALGTRSNGSATSEKLRITSAGNVGIGNASPVQKLDVFGTPAAPATSGSAQNGNMRIGSTATVLSLDLGIDNTGATPYSWLQSRASSVYSTNYNLALNPNGGNVGIGTTTPSARLTVGSPSAYTGDVFRAFATNEPGNYNLTLNMTSPGAGVVNYSFNTVNSGTTYNNNLVLDRGNVGIGTTTPGAKLELYNTGTATTLGQLDTNLRLYTNTGTANAGNEISFAGTGGTLGQNIYAAISAPVTANTSGAAGYLSFSTKIAGATSLTERLRITGGGNVGIGQTTPTAKLDVETTSTSQFGALFYSSATAGSNNVVHIDTSSTNSGDTPFYITANNGVNPLMIVRANGNVGIGTTSPSQMLEVGSVSSLGAITVSSGGSASDNMSSHYGYYIQRGDGLVETAVALDSSGNEHIGTFRSANLQLYTNNTRRLTIDSSGRIGAGASPDTTFRFNAAGGASYSGLLGSTSLSGGIGVYGTTDTSGAYAAYFVVASGGHCSLAYGGSTWACSSDERLKTDITTISGTDALAGLAKIDGVLFNWKSLPAGDQQMGVIAQTVQGAFPDAVSTDKDGYLAVSYDSLIAPLISGVNALNIRTTYTKAAFAANAAAFGLASTTAPVTLLTADGTGVDIYKLATYNLGSVASLTVQLAAQATRMDTLEDRIKKLEDGSIAMATSSPFSTTTLLSALNSLGVYIQQGVAQFGTLVADRFVAATDSSGTSSAGSATILAGNTVIEITNGNASPTAKVFVTFTSSVSGSWYLSNKQQGSFRVSLENAQGSDVSFDYFIVQTVGQIATSTSQFGGTGSSQGGSMNGSTPPPPPAPPTDSGSGSGTDTGTTTPDGGSTGTSTPPTGDGSTGASQDTEPPTITLNGSAALQLTVGGTFTDPGATASDVVDGDLTSHITEEGTVDTATVGSYTLTYSVADAAGNEAHVSRLVNVAAPAAPAGSGEATSTTP